MAHGSGRDDPPPRLPGLLARDPVAFRHDESTGATWIEAPRPEVTVMIDLEGSLHSDGAPLPGAWVSGLGDRAVEVSLTGPYACIDLKLTPLGAYRLLGGRPQSELVNVSLPVGAAFGARGEELVSRLRDADGWPERWRLLDTFLRRRAAAGPDPSPFVAWTWERILASGGRASVAALAGEVGCSPRHLQARFRREVGLTPKTALRVARFRAACAAFERAPERWADIAAGAGYADQSHLDREFRRLAGMTPTAYVARCAREFRNVQARGNARA